MRKKVMRLALSSMLTALSFISAVLLAVSFPVGAQQATKVHRIGYLIPNSPSTDPARIEAFRQGLRELRYVEGKNISIVPPGRARLATKPAATGFPPDAITMVMVVVAFFAANTDGVPEHTMISTPRRTSSAASAGRRSSLPSANRYHRLANLETQLITKRLEMLKEVVPRLTRVGVLWFGGGPGIQQRLALKELRTAAVALEVQLHEIERPKWTQKV